MRSLRSPLLWGMLLAGMYGCAPSTPPAPKGPIPEVGLFLPETKSNWGRNNLRVSKAAIQAHASDCTVNLQDAEGDPKKQSTQIADEVAKKPIAILVSPVSDEIAPALLAAQKAKICVIVLDKRVKGFDEDAYVGPNAKITGSSLGSVMCDKKTLSDPKVIIIGKSNQPGDEEKFSGALIAFKHVKAKLPAVLQCDGTERGAEAVSEAYFKKNPAPAEVAALTGEMALGLTDAEKTLNYHPIRVLTVGEFDPRVLNAIKSGEIYETLTEPPGAPMALDLIPNLIQHIKPQKFSTTTVDQVTSANVAQFLSSATS